MASRLLNPGPRTRKALRYVGFAVLGLVTFVFAFQMTFPFGRVKEKVIELLSDKYEVSIGDVERGFIPGRMYFKAVTLRTRPTKAEEVATTFYIEQLEVDLGLLALLHGTAAVKFDAKIGPSHLKGALALSKAGTSVEVTGHDLPSALLPMREVIGLPMSGKIGLVFELELPNEKTKAGKIAPSWPKAEGRVELECPSSCTVGDGKTKLKVNVANKTQQAFAENGIDFGEVHIDSLHAAVEIKDSKLTVTKFDAKSGDGELHVDFEMALNQDVGQSLVTGCLRFNVTSVLLKREPKTYAAITTTGAPLGPDNLFHIKLQGPVRQMRRLGLVCGAAAGKNPEGEGDTTPRPNLPVAPEAPARPPAGVIPPPQLPLVPPAPLGATAGAAPAPVPESAGGEPGHAPTPAEAESAQHGVVPPPGAAQPPGSGAAGP